MPEKTTIIRALRDNFLVIKTKKGDEKAYAAIYDRYFDNIYQFIYFKVRGVETAEDIAADVFFKVWQYIAQGAKVKNLRALLYKTARNSVIDHYRKKKELALDEKVSETIVYKAPSIHDRLADQERSAQLMQALNTLKDEYKEAVQLRYMQELSYKEIASIIGKSSGAVRVLVHRGLQELKKLF